MSTHSVHVIHSECDIYVQVVNSGVRVRVSELDSENPNPTIFEIEGDAKHISDALATAAAILANMEVLTKEPN